MTVSPILAVHLSDGVLGGPWLLGGYLGAAALLWLSLHRLNPEEIPRIALLTAAFFIASLIHVRAGPVSVHLLLNGLVGVMLIHRAPLALTQGLLLQFLMIGHGGWTTLGVNVCVVSLPAVVVGWLFGIWWKTRGRRSVGRSLGVLVVTFIWLCSVAASVEMLYASLRGESVRTLDFWTNAFIIRPETITALVVLSGLIWWWEGRWSSGPEFSIGLILGVITVLLTVTLNFLVLLLGGVADWQTLAVLVLIAHLPIAAVEGLILGFTVPFLAKVSPQLLTGHRAPSSVGNTSSSGTSH